MAINFPDPSASPWYNDPASGGNGVTYVYTSGGYWTAVQVTGSNAIDQTTGDARYVNVSGDSMTGGLNVAGNVGIGTSSPSDTLHLNGTTGYGLKITDASSHIATYRTHGDGAILKTASNHALLFGTNDTERMRIDSSGNVGIGTTSPGQSLDIESGSSTTGRVTAHGYICRDNWGSASSLGNGMMSPATNSLAFTTNSTERMRIDSSGRLLVGTSSDTTARLVVKGAAGSGDDGINVISGSTTVGSKAAIFFSPSTSGSFSTGSAIKTERLSPDGSDLQFYTCTALGSAPTERMRIGSDGNVQISMGGSGYATLFRYGTNEDNYIRSGVNGITAFGDHNGGERMRIDSSGRLLVGTSSASNQNNAGGASAREAKAYIFNANQTTTERYSLAINSGSTNASGASLHLNKTRSTTDAHTVVQSDDVLGEIRFQGSDGTFYVQGARIQAEVDGTPGSQDMPGRLVFSTTADGASSPTERMRIDSSGNLLFKQETASSPYPEQKLKWSNDSTTTNGFYISQDTARNGRVWHEQGLDVLFGTNNSEAMRIDSSGSVMIGKTTTSNIQVDGFEVRQQSGAQVNLTNSGNGVPAMYINNRYGAGTQQAIQFYFGSTHVGSITTTSTTTAFTNLSDYRLKENVVDIADGITRVKQLQPKRFNFIADANTTIDGFLAHEAQTVVPEAVTGTYNEIDEDGNPAYQGIDQSKLVPLLTAALQEAIGEIESLKARVAALEAL
jgi:hypothetical protein